MHQYVYVNYSRIIFYSLGNYSIPAYVYLEGLSDGIWHVLGGTGGYVEAGGWLEKVIHINSLESYRKYRLISLGGPFGVRRWDMLSNQHCECVDGSRLTLLLNSTEGLQTVQDLLDEIDYFNENVYPNDCRCENNCIVQISGNVTGNFSNDGLCEDVIAAAADLGLPPDLILLNSTSHSLQTLHVRSPPEHIFHPICYR